MGPLMTYTPFKNLNVEDFVFMKLHDPNGAHYGDLIWAS
jgi:hypothetical protein